MKTTLKTVIIAVLFISFSKLYSQTVDGTWVAVESRHADETSWISPLDGMLLDFEQNLLKITHVNSDSVGEATISYLQNSQLLIQHRGETLVDTLVIHQVSNDSITLLFNGNMLVKLVPIDLTNKSNLAPSELTQNNWIYLNEQRESYIHFKEDDWYSDYPGMRKKCIVNGNVESYSLKNFKGVQLLSITYWQLDLLIYQIERFENGIIHTRLLSAYQEAFPKIIQQKSIDAEKKKVIKSAIQGHWNTIDLIDYYTGFEELSGDSTEFESTGFSFYIGLMLKKRALLNKKITFIFDSNTYQIRENGIIIFKGEFQISHDGKFIVLNKGLNPEDYISMIKFSDEELIIQKEDDFAIAKEGEFIHYTYQLRLKKQ